MIPLNFTNTPFEQTLPAYQTGLELITRDTCNLQLYQLFERMAQNYNLTFLFMASTIILLVFLLVYVEIRNKKREKQRMVKK